MFSVPRRPLPGEDIPVDYEQGRRPVGDRAALAWNLMAADKPSYARCSERTRHRQSHRRYQCHLRLHPARQQLSPTQKIILTAVSPARVRRRKRRAWRLLSSCSTSPLNTLMISARSGECQLLASSTAEVCGSAQQLDCCRCSLRRANGSYPVTVTDKLGVPQWPPSRASTIIHQCSRRNEGRKR